jgi:hypothetical protein
MIGKRDALISGTESPLQLAVVRSLPQPRLYDWGNDSNFLAPCLWRQVDWGGTHPVSSPNGFRGRGALYSK